MLADLASLLTLLKMSNYSKVAQSIAKIFENDPLTSSTVKNYVSEKTILDSLDLKLVKEYTENMVSNALRIYDLEQALKAANSRTILEHLKQLWRNRA